MIVRILIWHVAESRSTIDELRESLPELEPAGHWISNEATERFGAVVFGEEDLPEAIGWAQDLVGGEPDVYEEFDAL